MATSKEYRDVVLEKCNLLDLITCRAMMGEYLLYYNKILFGGIYNERFLIKIVDENKKYKLKEAIPYERAKPMYWIENLDDQKFIRQIVLDTVKGLENKK